MESKEKIGLFFGSFNPPTTSHINIAISVVEETDIDKLWFVLSPQNPDKKDNPDLLDFDDREALLIHALTPLKKDIGVGYFEHTDVENHLERPSYTYKTISHLKSMYKDVEFKMVMGEDVFSNIHNWRGYDHLKGEKALVVPRSLGAINADIVGGQINEFVLGEGLERTYNYPMLHCVNLSSSIVRERIKNDKSVTGLVTDQVLDVIKQKGFYKHKNQ